MIIKQQKNQWNPKKDVLCQSSQGQFPTRCRTHAKKLLWKYKCVRKTTDHARGALHNTIFNGVGKTLSLQWLIEDIGSQIIIQARI